MKDSAARDQGASPRKPLSVPPRPPPKGLTPTPPIARGTTAPLAPRAPAITPDEGWEEAPENTARMAEEPTITQPRQQSGIAPKLAPSPPPLPVAPKEDTRAIVKAAVAEATAPLLKQIEELRARIHELEKRPIPPPEPTPRIMTMAMPQTAPSPYAAVLERPASPAPPAVAVAPAPVVSLAPAPVLPIPTGVIDMDVPFDGRRRQRRVVFATVFTLLVVMAAFFTALGYSHLR